MGIPSSPEALASILRLQGLKNVSPRRVMDGNDELQNLNSIDTDVSGTASPMPLNTPSSEMGGELNPQSYDVRANSVQSPDEQESTFSKIGRFLGNALTKNAVPEDIGMLTEGIGNVLTKNAVPQHMTGIKEHANKLMGSELIGDSLSKHVPQPQQSQGLPPSPPTAPALSEPPISGNYMHAGYAPSIPAEPQAEPNVLQKLGTWIKDGWTPNPEKIRENAAKMPPMDLLSIPPIVKSLFGVAGQQFIPDTLGDVDKQQEWAEYRENQAMRARGLDPTKTREQKEQELAAGVESAANQPWQHSVYGAAEVVASHPALQEKFKKITGIDYGPQIAQKISDYEAGMQGVEDTLNGNQTSLTEQENTITQRILNNQVTDADMYYIGLALLMPLLVGGLFGKEAGLGALAGGAKGVAESIARREKDIRSDESALLDISRQKSANAEKLASMALERSQLEGKLRKALPDDPREHLFGKREVEWVDPETNQVESAVEILPGLVADNSFVTTKEGLASRVKAADELSGIKSYVDELNDLTNDIIEITSQLEDQNPVSQMWSAFLAKKDPGSLSKTTQDVEFDGRRVNAGSILQQKLGLLANAYSRAKDIGQLDRAAQAHMANLFTNPTASLSSPKNTIDQMIEIRKLAQRGLVKEAQGKGFIPEFLQNQYDEKNRELFSRLNKKQQDLKVNELLKKTARSGTSYGQ